MRRDLIMIRKGNDKFKVPEEEVLKIKDEVDQGLIAANEHAERLVSGILDKREYSNFKMSNKLLLTKEEIEIIKSRNTNI